MQVADDNDVDVAIQIARQRRGGATQDGDPVEQNRVGQHARIAHLDEHGRVAEKSGVCLDHAVAVAVGAGSISSSGSTIALSAVAIFIQVRSCPWTASAPTISESSFQSAG